MLGIPRCLDSLGSRPHGATSTEQKAATGSSDGAMMREAQSGYGQDKGVVAQIRHVPQPQDVSEASEKRICGEREKHRRPVSSKQVDK